MNGGGNSGNRPQQKSNGILFGHDQRRGNVLGAGSNHTGAIVGGVVGGFFGLLLLAWLIGSTVWSWRSYSFRAHKRLLEDQVYSIVVGMRSDDIFAAGSAEETPNEKDTVDIDRFYNLLPFMNRMPRNQYYAKLTRSVAHTCLSHWSNRLGTRPRAAPNGVLNARFEGNAAEALAFVIMKHDTTWSATDNAILQQWSKGRAARSKIVHQIEHLLEQPEVSDFLDGLDARLAPQDHIGSQGLGTTLKRMFCCALPPQVLKATVSNEPAGDRAWDESLFNVDLPTAHMKGTSSGEPSELGQGAWLDGPLTSNVSKMTGTNTSKAASDHAAAMSAVIKELQLDDWEIKPNEIEIMKEPNGEQCKLGEGAFGSVFKAKWNGVQIVAVKQLHNVTSKRAELEFLREVAVLKRLRAENIVRFLGVCIQDSQTMLVTEFMSNGSLHSGLKRSREDMLSEQSCDLSWYSKGKRIAMDLTRGVAFLHSQGIVHFDLKSPNILLARDYTAKVADVGLAKFMTSEHFTQITTIGTLAWAAPELLNPHLGTISSKVDVYSLGVVIWELVTGECPRFGQNWWRPPRVPEECPQWVADLIAACVYFDPAQRLTSKDVYHALLADNFEAS